MNTAETEALLAENKQLRTDLDSRFEHSDHQTAKYYHRMRIAERERDALQAQLDSIRGYAEERAAYGRSYRTVGSARIASDLFAILDPIAEEEPEPSEMLSELFPGTSAALDRLTIRGVSS